ncbi:amidase family protein [Vagococcus luciliae]|uniref:6-aminohexanoate-cyclic-dimer hydrolase n=1 Tax=Vagococcus luciliae TaxID=2920380 RepID=A0ABY5P037_9ENTE|nr:amidase family protein [Vagococcus luciliae]UUV99174.1 6-aminohexanoate-cyclic-dimer hydrolase [Vagococcus luciliae]
MKDATFWANEIQQKKISVEELLNETYNKVIEHSELNCFVGFDEESYHQLLQSLKTSNKESPFYGVPFPLKNIGQQKKGWLNTAGAKLMTGNQSSLTDNYVKQIEEAGFIPFGKTNAPEFGFKNVTDPLIYGVTKNAWNKDYHAGGSSGGAASAIASGVIPLAGASDGGGSIRIPASFSGLLGLKPSRGNIVTGPDEWRAWQGASVNFVLGVSVRDARAMLEILKPTQQISPFLAPQNFYKQKKTLKIAVCNDSPVGNKVSHAAKQSVEKAIKFLVSEGHDVVEIPYPVNGDELIRSYYTMNGGETSAMMTSFKTHLQRELSIEDMEHMTWTLYQYGETLSASDYIQSFYAWDKATQVMEELFEEYDLFLSPSATTTAPKIIEDLQSNQIRQSMRMAHELTKKELAELVYAMFEKSLHMTPYTQLANLTGQPAINLPIYVAENGLPIGVQFMAAKGNDKLLLDVAEIFEYHQQFVLPMYYNH